MALLTPNNNNNGSQSNNSNNNQQQNQGNTNLDLNSLFFNMGNDGVPNFSQLAPVEPNTNQNNNSSILNSLTTPQPPQDQTQQLISQQSQQIQALQTQLNQLLGAYNGVQQTIQNTNNNQSQQPRKSLTERFSEPDGEQYLANLLVQAVNMGVDAKLQPLQPVFQQQMQQSQIQQIINNTAQQIPDFYDVVTPNQAVANQLLAKGFSPREIYLSLKLESMSNGNQNNNLNNNNNNNVVSMTPQRSLTQDDYNRLQQQQKNLYMSSGNFGQLTGNNQFSNPSMTGNSNRNPTLDEAFAMAVNQHIRK